METCSWRPPAEKDEVAGALGVMVARAAAAEKPEVPLAAEKPDDPPEPAGPPVPPSGVLGVDAGGSEPVALGCWRSLSSRC